MVSDLTAPSEVRRQRAMLVREVMVRDEVIRHLCAARKRGHYTLLATQAHEIVRTGDKDAALALVCYALRNEML